MTGKSSLGSVASWKFGPPRLHGQAALRALSFAQRHPSAPSGNFRTISCRVNRRDRRRTRALDHGGGLVDHLDIEVGRAEADGIAPGPRSGHWRGSEWYAPFHDRLRLRRQRATAWRRSIENFMDLGSGQVRGPRAYPPPPSAQPFFSRSCPRAPRGVKPHPRRGAALATGLRPRACRPQKARHLRRSGCRPP